MEITIDALGSVVVTGGTGSFGKAFTRAVLDQNRADRVVIFSRDELKQSHMRAEFGFDRRLRFYLGDVRDVWQLRRAFAEADHVVHAAALKQVDRSALDVLEFIKTNVQGTCNVVEAAHECGVAKAVVLSTDKAVAAATPYGATKYLAEWVAVAANVYGPARICAVRYGNVIGSRGSVLDIWRRQVEEGRPITITDPRMTRFWLPIEQAVELVLFALAHTGGGEIFIPKIEQRGLVTEFARKHFPDHPQEIVGPRSYEKVHEVLVSREEAGRCVDVGYCYVLLPLHVRWEPGPYGAEEGEPVPEGFEYGSNGVEPRVAEVGWGTKLYSLVPWREPF